MVLFSFHRILLSVVMVSALLASQAAAQLVTPTRTIVSLDSTSSDNLVVGRHNILHCVYADRQDF